MRILMFSWEYPPKVVGGLSRHVQELCRALADEHEVHVITQGDDGGVDRDMGVWVHRAEVPGPRVDDFLQWASQLTVGMLVAGARLINDTGSFDIVHAHDWTSAFAGVGIKHAYDIPLVATVHATEYGRNNGLHTPVQRRISDIEWYLGYEAWRVIVCSEPMRRELMAVFGIPGDKLRVIPNGVAAQHFVNASCGTVGNMGFSPDDEIIVFVGRLVHEKGVQVLLEAMPQVLATHPRAVLALIGTGPHEQHLRQLAGDLGVAGSVRMLGFVSDSVRNGLYGAAKVAVVPSLYEPFGITALEAMAAGTPLIASDTGGLSEIVRHGKNGIITPAGNPQELASNIVALLGDEQLRHQLARAGSDDVRRLYDWRAICKNTISVYSEVLREANADTADLEAVSR